MLRLRRILDWFKTFHQTLKAPDGFHCIRTVDKAIEESLLGRQVVIGYNKFAQVHELSVTLTQRGVDFEVYWPYEGNEGIVAVIDQKHKIVCLPSSIVPTGWRFKQACGLSIVFMRTPLYEEKTQLLYRCPDNTRLHVVLP